MSFQQLCRRALSGFPACLRASVLTCLPASRPITIHTACIEKTMIDFIVDDSSRLLAEVEETILAFPMHSITEPKLLPRARVEFQFQLDIMNNNNIRVRDTILTPLSSTRFSSMDILKVLGSFEQFEQFGHFVLLRNRAGTWQKQQAYFYCFVARSPKLYVPEARGPLHGRGILHWIHVPSTERQIYQRRFGRTKRPLRRLHLFSRRLKCSLNLEAFVPVFL